MVGSVARDEEGHESDVDLLATLDRKEAMED